MTKILHARCSGALLSLFGLVVGLCSSAQDPHFSQFYSSPLTLNPAMTGLFSGEMRFTMNYRNQWKAVSTPFTTATAACDFQVLNDRIDKDVFGIGVIGMLDQSNNQGLKANFLALTAAYNKNIGNEGHHKIGIGFQTSFVSKKADYSRFTFSRQFTPFGFDPSASNGEPLSGFNLSYLDVATGILYSGMNENMAQWYVGGSYYHINRPNEAVSTEENRLQPRMTIHSGFNFPTTELGRLYLSGLYMKSMITKEMLFGTIYESMIPGAEYENSLYVGAYYRIKDAIIPYVGYGSTKFQLGFSYDINISSLNTATMSRGGFEVSLQMNMSQNEEARKIPKCYNRF
ncbi:MAG: PorP/SprF family type IX secretion system membrane protein [Ferruginibacter sp.]